MDLPTYTNIWRIEKRLYKLYDLRLPMPLPLVQIGVFIGVFVPWIVFLRVVGLPFHAPWHVLYIVPPGVLTWLGTRPVIEGKRLTELLLSQARYLTEPRTWCRLTPIREPREVVVTVRVWRRRGTPAPVATTPGAALTPAARKEAGRAATRRSRRADRQAERLAAAAPGRAAARTAGAALSLRAAAPPPPLTREPYAGRPGVPEHVAQPPAPAEGTRARARGGAAEPGPAAPADFEWTGDGRPATPRPRAAAAPRDEAAALAQEAATASRHEPVPPRRGGPAQPPPAPRRTPPAETRPGATPGGPPRAATTSAGPEHPDRTARPGPADRPRPAVTRADAPTASEAAPGVPGIAPAGTPGTPADVAGAPGSPARGERNAGAHGADPGSAESPAGRGPETQAGWRSIAKWPPPAPFGRRSGGRSGQDESAGQPPPGVRPENSAPEADVPPTDRRAPGPRPEDGVLEGEVLTPLSHTEPPAVPVSGERTDETQEPRQGSGKRGLASGVRRPGGAAEFWEAISTETPPPAPEPEPGPPVTETRPDIPMRAATTRPDIPMVPGAFGVPGRPVPPRPEPGPVPGAQGPAGPVDLPPAGPPPRQMQPPSIEPAVPVRPEPRRAPLLPPPVDLAQASIPLREVRDALVWPPPGQKRRARHALPDTGQLTPPPARPAEGPRHGRPAEPADLTTTREDLVPPPALPQAPAAFARPGTPADAEDPARPVTRQDAAAFARPAVPQDDAAPPPAVRRDTAEFAQPGVPPDDAAQPALPPDAAGPAAPGPSRVPPAARRGPAAPDVPRDDAASAPFGGGRDAVAFAGPDAAQDDAEPARSVGREDPAAAGRAGGPRDGVPDIGPAWVAGDDAARPQPVVTPAAEGDGTAAREAAPGGPAADDAARTRSRGSVVPRPPDGASRDEDAPAPGRDDVRTREDLAPEGAGSRDGGVRPPEDGAAETRDEGAGRGRAAGWLGDESAARGETGRRVPRPWPPQGPGIPGRAQGTPYKAPPPSLVPEQASGDDLDLPLGLLEEDGGPGGAVRSGPASPVRPPRPRLTPPEPPDMPTVAAITPPDVELEGTAGGLRRLIQAVGGGGGQIDAEYEERLQRPFQGTRHIVVLGCTGGAGQTVTGLMLGHTFAQYCGEPIVAVDVNPGSGALARRTRSETPETLTTLIARADQVHSLTAMRRYTSQAKSGLDVIAAGKNPLQALDDRDYAQAIRTLDKFYSITFIDAAAAIVARVLPHADQIVLVAPASSDASRAVGMTFEWLDGHGYGELRGRAVTVINGVSRRSLEDVEQAEAVARGRCRALVRIPWDDHLSLDRAPRNELKALRAPTRRAYLALAGVVAGGFTVLPERYRQGETDGDTDKEIGWEQEAHR